MILTMKLAIDHLPDDPKILKEVIVEFYNETSVLKEQIALLKHMLFGRKSEKYKAENGVSQLKFDFDGESAEKTSAEDTQPETTTVEVSSHKRRKRGRKPLSASLPREERIFDISEAEKVCECGSPKSVIGKETSEHLEYIPAKCKVIVNIRPKYACRNCEGAESEKPAVTVAPPPPQIIPKSFATASLLAYLITSKYVDCLPFYRLSKMFSRHGVELSRATMCNWVLRVASLLKFMPELFVEEIHKSSYVHADETPFQVLKEVGRSADQKSQMWVIRTDDSDNPTVLFHYDTSRSAKVAESLLQDFKGYIQTDACPSYNWIGKNAHQKHLGCLAHVRRKFHDAIKAVGKNAKPGIAHKAFAIIAKLYAVEHEAQEKGLDFEQIATLRQEKAKPILDELHAKLKKWKVTVLPKSNTGKAISYTLKAWEKLVVYLEDGKLKIDNNAAERTIRPFALGRRNWLFSDTAQGAKASATIFSLTETAKANNLDPYWYMLTLLEKLPELTKKEDFIAWIPQNIDKKLVEEVKNKYQSPVS